MADVRPATTAGPTLRVTEILAGLSLTTDLATGAPMETGLAVCAVATAFAGTRGLDTDARRAVFHTALLGAVGCTSYASENAALFDDDTAFQAALHALDPGDPDLFARQMAEFGAWSGPGAVPELSARFLRLAPTEGPAAMRASCEVSRALGPRLGLPQAAVTALEDVHERWDGHGIPGVHAGEALPLPARILHLSEQAVHAHTRGGTPAAVAELRRRAGGHLDPDLVTAFLADADALLGVLDGPDLLAHVIAAEPGLPAVVPPDGLDRHCLALSVVADLKGRYLLGHSAHTAALADAAAGLAGFDAGPGRNCAPRRSCTTWGGSPCRARSGTGPAPCRPGTGSGCGCTPTGPAGSCCAARRSRGWPRSRPATTSGATAAATTAARTAPTSRSPPGFSPPRMCTRR